MSDFITARDESHRRRKEPIQDVRITNQGTSLGLSTIEGRALYPGGDAPRKTYEGSIGERLTEVGGDIAQTAGSLATGVAAGAVGLPGDLASLIGGLSSALFPGDKPRIEAAVDTMTKISETVGSEKFLNIYRDFVNESELSSEDKQMMLDAAETGSFLSIPGAGIAAAKSKDVIREGISEAGKAADARLAADAGGTTLSMGVDPTKAIDTALSAAGRAVRPKPSEYLRTIPADDSLKRIKEITAARDAKGKTTVEDLHKYFDEAAIQRHGRKLNIVDNPEDYRTVQNDLKEDIIEQSKLDVSGKGWYDEDVLKTFATFANIPGFEKLKDNETQRVIFSAVLGVTSPGPKVAQNTRSGAAQYLQYLQTGKFSTEAPPAGTAIGGIEKAGFGQYGFPQGLKMLQHLLDTLGEEATADFLLSPHTKGDLIRIRKAAGFKSNTVSGMSGKADSLHFGAAIFGDKAGKFVLNINGYQGTTKDKWFVRTIRREEGTHADNIAVQRDKKKGTEKIVELGTPRNLAERQTMDRMVAELVKDPELSDLNLSERDAQAMLWFREQNLYSDLGVESRPQTFSEGAELVSGQTGFGIRGGDETKAKIESGEEELPGYRSVTRKQRTVRSNRRQQLESLNRPEGGETTSRPYTTTSGTDAGAGRVLEPNPPVLEKYQAAGLNIPRITKVDANSSQQYRNDMVSAMEAHPMGAQVELKSADELSKMQLYRTDGGSGFAIKSDGDIVAVFAGPGEPRGGSYAMLQAAVDMGGKKLDAFNTYLPDIYETVGFRPVSRLKWNDDFAPDNWNKETFKEFQNGEPDVVFFVYDPKYFADADYDSLPVFTNYDEAAAVQDAELAKLGGD